MYHRDESAAVKAFYNLPVTWLEPTPTAVLSLAERLALDTKLPRAAEEYPTDGPTLRYAAQCLERAAKDLFEFRLDIKDEDATQLDRFNTRHLLDAVKPGVPREPLLIYCLGAFWGEWLVRNRDAVWALYPPLNPMQSFPDMVSSGPALCSHPFSQVCKQLGDPEGDNLAYKAHVSGGLRQYLPPFPLLASLADADYAVRGLLPEPAQRALDAEQAGDDQSAFELLCAAAAEDDQQPQLLSRIIACAWRLEKYNMVVGVSERLLKLVPDHPLTCHNLAILYASQSELMEKAIELLQRAIQVDRNYSRARLTLAAVLAQVNRTAEARELAQWVCDNDPQLKAEAEEFLIAH